MGWLVIGYGQIEVEEKNEKKVLKKLKEHIGDINYDDNLSIEMSGNKMINYAVLDEIKDWAKKNKISMEISINEYVENGGGYYWDSEEDDEDEKKRDGK